MYILGFNCFVFNSAACLIKDGKIIAAAQEERFTREKCTGVFPENAIRYCLKEAGITINDVDYVGFHWKPFHKFHHRIWQIISNMPRSLNFYGTHGGNWLNMVRVKSIFKKRFASELKGRQPYKFIRVKHPVCHAASAFYVSPFEEAAVITMDGSGEIASTTFQVGRGKKLETIDEINFPHSLGYIFVSLTHYLGYRPNSDEFKLMSLQSYGTDRYYDEFKKIIKLKPKGRYEVDLSYFNYHAGVRDPWVSDKFIKIFGPMRAKEKVETQEHMDICWALQKRLEDVALHMAEYVHRVTKLDYLCLAGGTALNSVMNGVLLKKGPFKDIFIQPAANDTGTGLGSAYYIYNSILEQPRVYSMNNIYTGPKYNENEVKDVVEKSGMKYTFYNDKDLYKTTAKLISEGNIIGWFQDGMEFGPRALGSRSILADPRNKDMKNILNRKVKHREGFRPFAPSILSEYSQDFFEFDRPSPYMTFVCDVKKDKYDVLPGITHIDGTARMQTVDKNHHEKFWNLIKNFYDLTSVPVVINTSFNVMGEPIVCHPQDAFRCFKSTGIDYLVIGNYIVTKD